MFRDDASMLLRASRSAQVLRNCLANCLVIVTTPREISESGKGDAMRHLLFSLSTLLGPETVQSPSGL